MGYKCKKCGIMTGPSLHSGCDKSGHPDCAWYIRKNNIKKVVEKGDLGNDINKADIGGNTMDDGRLS